MDENIGAASCVLDRRPVVALGDAPLPDTAAGLPPVLAPPRYPFVAAVDDDSGWEGRVPAATPAEARRLLDEVVYGLRHGRRVRVAAWGYALTTRGWYGVLSYDWGER